MPRIIRNGQSVEVGEDYLDGLRAPPPGPVTAVSRVALAVACSQPPFRVISETEAEKWGAGLELPLSIRTAINAQVGKSAAQMMRERIEALTVETIRRHHPTVALAQHVFRMGDARVDELFEAAAAV